MMSFFQKLSFGAAVVGAAAALTPPAVPAVAATQDPANVRKADEASRGVPTLRGSDFVNFQDPAKADPKGEDKKGPAAPKVIVLKKGQSVTLPIPKAGEKKEVTYELPKGASATFTLPKGATSRFGEDPKMDGNFKLTPIPVGGTSSTDVFNDRGELVAKGSTNKAGNKTVVEAVDKTTFLRTISEAGDKGGAPVVTIVLYQK